MCRLPYGPTHNSTTERHVSLFCSSYFPSEWAGDQSMPCTICHSGCPQLASLSDRSCLKAWCRVCFHPFMPETLSWGGLSGINPECKHKYAHELLPVLVCTANVILPAPVTGGHLARISIPWRTQPPVGCAHQRGADGRNVGSREGCPRGLSDGSRDSPRHCILSVKCSLCHSGRAVSGLQALAVSDQNPGNGQFRCGDNLLHWRKDRCDLRGECMW